MDFYLGLIQIIGVHTLLGLSAYCVLLTGQISLAQIKHETRVPVLQVGHSGLAEARRLLDRAGRPGNGEPGRRPVIQAPLATRRPMSACV